MWKAVIVILKVDECPKDGLYEKHESRDKANATSNEGHFRARSCQELSSSVRLN